VTRMESERNMCIIFLSRSDGKEYLLDQRHDVNKNNKFVLNLMWGFGLDSSGSGLGPVAESPYTPWPSVRKRTIPTERPPLVNEI
jgi:hypothetical protein